MNERIVVMVFAYCTVLVAMWWTTRLVGNERRQLLSAVLSCFVGLVLIFVIDKLAVNYNLLNDTESESVFSLIDSIMLIVVGYFFGKTGSKDDV